MTPFKEQRTKGGKVVTSKYYTIKWKDESGQWRKKTASTDLKASLALLRKKEEGAARKRQGLPVTEDADRLRPWSDVSEAFLAELVARGSDPAGSHRRDVRCILRKVGDACKWSRLADVRPDRFGKYLADLAAQGKSAQTRKNHFSVIRSLLNWCVVMQWLDENPIARLTPPSVGQAGKVYLRRAYTREEFGRLLSVTPEPRRTVYLIAGLSGYRRVELGRMERRDLDPAGEEPEWHLRATESKNGRCDTVPILPDLLPALTPLWSSLPKGTSRLVADGLGCAVPRCETLHAVLARAGIPALDEEGRSLEFHSFRYTFCRFMAEVLPMEIVKVLMRHATITLTIDLYGKLGLKDLGVKMKMLPSVFRADQWGARRPRPDSPRPGVVARVVAAPKSPRRIAPAPLT